MYFGKNASSFPVFSNTSLASSIDRTTDGIMWTVWNPNITGTIYCSFSLDNGRTWTSVANIATTGTIQRCGLYIDEDNYLHIVYTKYGQQTDGASVVWSGDYSLHYMRGIINATKDNVTWSAEQTIQASISLSTGYRYDKIDIVVVKYSTGWRGAVVWGQTRDDGTALASGVGLWGYFRQLTITGTTSTTVTMGSTTTIFSYSGSNPASGTQISVDFKHNGDGKTSKDTTPHLYVAFDALTGLDGTPINGIKFKKATFSAGSWTFGTEVAIDSSSTSGLFNCIFNGTDPIIVSEMAGAGVIVYTRNEANTATTVDTISGLLNSVNRSTRACIDTQKNIYVFCSPYKGSSSIIDGEEKYGYLKWDYTTKALIIANEKAIWYKNPGTTYINISRYHLNDKFDIMLSAGDDTSMNIYGSGIHTFNDIKNLGVNSPSVPTISLPSTGTEISQAGLSSIQLTTILGTDQTAQLMYYSLSASADNRVSYKSLYYSEYTNTKFTSGSSNTISWNATNYPEGKVSINALAWDTDGNITDSVFNDINIGDFYFSHNITSANMTLGRHGKRMDKTSDGTLLSVLMTNISSAVVLYYSKNNGKTWTQASITGTTSNLAGRTLSIFIDEDDYLHIATTRLSGTSSISYSRATPNADKTSWDFGPRIAIIGSITGMFPVDIVAHRGKTSGWVAHVVASSTSTVYYTRVIISADGLTITEIPYVTLASSLTNFANPSIDFCHSGNGKTIKNSKPDIYIMWSHNATGAGTGLRYKRLSYDSTGDTWTIGTEIEIDNTNVMLGTTNSSGDISWGHIAFNGNYVIICGAFKNTVPPTSTGSLSANIYVINPNTDVIINTTFISGGTFGPGTTWANTFAFGTWSYDLSGRVYIYGTNFSGVNTDGPRAINTAIFNVNTLVIEQAKTTINYTPLYTGGNLISRRNANKSVNVLLLESYYLNSYQVESYTVVLSSPPNTPTHTNLSGSGYTLNKRPKFLVSISNNDSTIGTVNAEIQVSTDNTFATTLFDVQYSNDSGFGIQTIGWENLPTANGSSFVVKWLPQADLPTSTTVPLYVRVRAKSSTLDWSSWSAIQTFYVYPENWTNIIPDNVYGMRYIWLNEIATEINNARAFRGLTSATFTNGTLSVSNDIKSMHVSERRTYLGDILTIVGITPVWTDSSLINADRKGLHLNELRNYLKQT